MRVVLKIMMYLMLLVLLTAEDCGFNNRGQQGFESPENVMFQELENGFITDELDAERLHFMEHRAVEKVMEFYQYLNIYADSDLDIQFRKQARQLACEAFVSEDNLQLFFLEQGLVEDMENYLLINSAGEKVQFDVTSVNLTKAFEYSQEGYNSCLISFVQNDTISFGVCAIKTTKSFGNENLDVWGLFLEH